MEVYLGMSIYPPNHRTYEVDWAEDMQLVQNEFSWLSMNVHLSWEQLEVLSTTLHWIFGEEILETSKIRKVITHIVIHSVSVDKMSQKVATPQKNKIT